MFSLLSIVLMTVDHRFHHLESLRTALSVVVYPLRYVVSLPSEFGDWASESFASRDTLEDENRTLHTRNLLLKGELQRMDALEAENGRLRELLRASKKVGGRVLIAELLAVDTDPFTRLVVLNKGSNDDVYPGQPMLDAEGVMGQVVHVGPFTSTAMLITDPSHAIPVLVNRNGLRAIAVGTGASDKLDLPNLPNNADIKPGDLLVTSGLGGVFPPGYPVGHVTTVEIDPSEAFAQIEAEPAAHLERSREVLLVWTKHKRPLPQAAAPDGKVSK